LFAVGETLAVAAVCSSHAAASTGWVVDAVSALFSAFALFVLLIFIILIYF